MKFTGWFNRKIQKKSVAPFNDLMIEPPNNEAGSGTKQRLVSTSCFWEPNGQAKKVYGTSETENRPANCEPFYNFLSIGTLGSNPIPIEDPVTPKIAPPLNTTVQKETAITDKDLVIINDEIDKFLEAEAKKAQNELSSKDPINTFSYGNVKTEKDGLECEEKRVCPLQGYLFGSQNKRPETNREALEKPAEVNIQDNKKQKSASYLIKKVLKKLSSTKSSSGDASTDYGSSKTKLQKGLKTLHKKVHRVTPIAASGLCSSQEYKVRNNACYRAKYNGDAMHIDTRHPQELKSGIGNGRPSVNLHGGELEDCRSRGNREHWIKTDENYLVLEL